MYKLLWPEKIDTKEVLKEAADFFGCSLKEVTNDWADYTAFTNANKYPKLLGELKTLNTLESFFVFLGMKLFNPDAIYEIGTHVGKSTRRMIDFNKSFGFNKPITCFDIMDIVKYFKKPEVKFVIKDITNTIKENIIDKTDTGLIYLDAHPYDITLNCIKEVLKTKDWTLVIHDCGKHLCNPKMKIRKDEPEKITSLTGHWERYVLAEAFGISDQLSTDLDYVETDTHKMKIFNTMHGICVILPK